MTKQNGAEPTIKEKNNSSKKDIYEEAKRKNIMDWGEIDTAESVIDRNH